MTSVPDNGVMLSTGITSLFLSLQMINLFYNSLLCGNRHLYKYCYFDHTFALKKINFC
jgi:hypothetical protein